MINMKIKKFFKIILIALLFITTITSYIGCCTEQEDLRIVRGIEEGSIKLEDRCGNIEVFNYNNTDNLNVLDTIILEGFVITKIKRFQTETLSSEDEDQLFEDF